MGGLLLAGNCRFRWQPDAIDRDDGLGQIGDLYLYRITGREREEYPRLREDAAAEELEREFPGYAPPRFAGKPVVPQSLGCSCGGCSVS